jgi:hypothetical protein
MNALHQDITNTVVVLKKEVFKAAYRALPYRLFRVMGGFGAQPHTMGRKIDGHYLFEPAVDRIKAGEGGEYDWTDTGVWTYGFHVERIATEADMQALAHICQAVQGHSADA